jgi:hypothetical protein
LYLLTLGFFSFLLHSNLHGLWVGPTVSTVAENSTEMMEMATDEDIADYVGMCQVASPVPGAFDSFDADFVLRQSRPPFSSAVPYDETGGKWQNCIAYY